MFRWRFIESHIKIPNWNLSNTDDDCVQCHLITLEIQQIYLVYFFMAETGPVNCSTSILVAQYKYTCWIWLYCFLLMQFTSIIVKNSLCAIFFFFKSLTFISADAHCAGIGNNGNRLFISGIVLIVLSISWWKILYPFYKKVQD